MNDAKARKLLEARRADLEQVIRAAMEQVSLDEPQASASGESGGADQHTADAATDTLEREMSLSVQESTETHIREIDAALKRLDAGTYGVCEVCGTKIPAGRLEAKPEAAYCVEHEPPAIPDEGAA